MKMFPGVVEWDLYDTGKFDEALMKIPGVTIYNKYFTDEIAKEYCNDNSDILFISDIRVAPENMEVKKMCENVEIDMQMQWDWVKLMKPRASLLKFRLPYVNTPEDAKPRSYLPGTIYMQAWAPVHSTETRLFTIYDKYQAITTNDIITYDPRGYESQCYEYNLLRGNTLSRDKYYVIQNQDSLLETYVLEEYIKKHAPGVSLHQIRYDIDDCLGMSFQKLCHKKINDWDSVSKLK